MESLRQRKICFDLYSLWPIRANIYYILQIVGDYFITAPTYQLAQILTSRNVSVYVYNYEYKSIFEQWKGRNVTRKFYNVIKFTSQHDKRFFPEIMIIPVNLLTEYFLWNAKLTNIQCHIFPSIFEPLLFHIFRNYLLTDLSESTQSKKKCSVLMLIRKSYNRYVDRRDVFSFVGENNESELLQTYRVNNTKI